MTRSISTIENKMAAMQGKLEKQATHYLEKFQKQELRLMKLVEKKDKDLAKHLFGGIQQQYESLKNRTASLGPGNVYSPCLDTIGTALNYLKTVDNQPGGKYSQQIDKGISDLGNLKKELNYSDHISQFLQQRQTLLNQQVQNLNIGREFVKYQKLVFYYKAQVAEYKQLIEEPSKAEERLVQLLKEVPAFKAFFASHSQTGQLFSLPGNTGSGPINALQGMQTRQALTQTLQSRFGAGSGIQAALKENIQQAQSALSSLQNMAGEYATGAFGNGTGELTAPVFKPNQQKVKSFSRRIQLGYNIQAQNASYYFPVTIDFGLSLGYKLNQKSLVGVGASYKLGLGENWSHIDISHQGIGLRSFIDWKLNGSFYLSGGYEVNYHSIFNAIADLKQYSIWQQSGLIGIGRQIQLKGKAKCQTKLLWDFLSYKQVPRTQAIIWRIGYTIR